MIEQERIKVMLDSLADFEAQCELLANDKQRAIKAAMPPDVVKALADIETEFWSKEQAAKANISELHDAIKRLVIALGETVKAVYGRATWNKPRVTWDNKGLDGYAIAHPEINVFRKVGEPSVSITITGIK